MLIVINEFSSITFIVHTSPKLLLIWTFALAKINTMHISVVKILPSKYNVNYNVYHYHVERDMQTHLQIQINFCVLVVKS